MLERVFVIVCAVVWLPYGVMCFLNPGLLAESAGIGASTATGTTELRAMYGGLQASIGVLALIAFLRPALTEAFLIALATVTAGLLTARAFGVLMDGGLTGYTGMALGFEVVLLACAAYFLTRRGPAPANTVIS